MDKILLLAACVLIALGLEDAHSQEIQLSTFQETAQLILDPGISNVTASIALQSTSNQEMMIPADLENEILGDGNIIAVVVTNEEGCVLGVAGESCVLINVQRNPEWRGINQIQDETKIIGDRFIGKINSFFGTDAAFNSVFIHHLDDANVALETSGVISGRNTVSAVYTMPVEPTPVMYEKTSVLLLPPQIRESGGFYDVATELSRQEGAKMTFSMIPQDTKTLFQLKMSVAYANTEDIGPEIRPADFFGTDRISRSDYFSQGFYPLNSVMQVVVLGDDAVWKVEPGFVDAETKNGITVPTDLRQSGWLPGSSAANDLVFLFGDKESIGGDELKIILDSARDSPADQDSESLIIVGVISVGAIGAAIFFLKGYRKGP